MSAFRKRSKSLDSFDVPDTKPFKLQRVASFQVYAQKEKVRLGILYPFLTQEQIYLKIKDRWNHMEKDLKQNYTKAVLYTTPTKKPACKEIPTKSSQSLLSKKDGQLELLKDSKHVPYKNDFCGNAIVLSKSVASKAKVVDWLNNPKQRRLSDQTGLKKTYDGTRYSLPYGIPTVIDPTPCKQPGILKCESSEKKKPTKGSKRVPRVSFSPNNRNLVKQSPDSKKVEGKTKKSVKNTMNSEYTSISSLFSEDQDTTERNSECEKDHMMENCDTKLQTNDTEGLVFQENIDDELFTTPEIGKLLLQEIGKAPRKRRSSETRTERPDNRRRTAKQGKASKLKMLNKTEKENSSNTNNLSLDVFGNKVWAATTYSKQSSGRKRTPKKKSEKKAEDRGRRSKDEDDGIVTGRKGSLVGPMMTDAGACASGNFIRNKRGLLVGPVGCDFDDMVDEAELSEESENEFVNNDESDFQDEKDLKFGKIDKVLDNKDTEKNVSKSTKRSSRTPVNCKAKKRQPDFKTKNSRKKQRNLSYCSDFDEVADMKSSPKETENQQKKESRKNRDTEEDMLNSESRLKHKMLSLCNDFAVEKPVSPIISEGSNSLSDELCYQGTTANIDGNPTLMKFLRKMKQLTLPSVLDMGDTSPKLLSPTLSGITELSSLSTASSVKESDQPFQSQLRTRRACDVKQPLEAQTFPSTSKSALRYSNRGQKGAKEYTVCSMFQDTSLPPRDIHKPSARRLVRSNSMPGRSNFDDMFGDRDIFH
ncbi:transcriptional regulator ATRX homolog [Haliotis cracherodii]|uniref:transcriptional regulator ATRX homolog n=1 Tax=Haliotis cracherodii TaxID=6455 RepID=UPI0039EADC42